MKRKTEGSQDPDILASEAAMRRAAKTALRIGLEKGTPVWVVKDGRLVDLTKEYVLSHGQPVRRKAERNGRSVRKGSPRNRLVARPS
jgi:hypothetical protein